MKTYNILVTGCGGDIAQSIGKILKLHPRFNSVIGCDLNNDHAGKFIFDRCLAIPSCHQMSYLPALEKIITENNIDIVLPASEPELRFLSERGIMDIIFGKPLISANKLSLDIGFDKKLTADFLKDKGLPYPETFLLRELDDLPFKMIIKSRNGSGSKSIFIIDDKTDFDFYKKKYPEFIGQKLIGDSDEEYTCGLFRDRNGIVRMLIYRRKLMGGFSGFGTVVENAAISDLLFKIAENLDLRGSINVQLRLENNIPFVFEINPRFSSTVLFRNMMGFEDVAWCIEDRLELPLASYSSPSTGTNFYKGFNEYVD